MLPAGHTSAALPVPDGFDGYAELSGTVSERQFQLQTARVEPRAAGIGRYKWQRMGMLYLLSFRLAKLQQML